ncbi:hypothetical protein PFICI_13649 [Pestalotiopsis fici W106-1]|uniref:Uncharacterized protein n=1 Tax=Pestalotiopsis fici (strain W106-1 / CGMCC3.15140) TaxID=1229662 RepID=W3WMM7_PESFW|nr:uncharacterized protein PFICI_13649 [Pestalotiopsis fici W106-1]ETS75165.1 hypothetical protein PFICI_13649 [Pestalotiopsis fici W106-1]
MRTTLSKFRRLKRTAARLAPQDEGKNEREIDIHHAGEDDAANDFGDEEPDDYFIPSNVEDDGEEEDESEEYDEIIDVVLSEHESQTEGKGRAKRSATIKAEASRGKRQRLDVPKTAAQVLAKINRQYPVAREDPDVARFRQRMAALVEALHEKIKEEGQ